MAFHPYRGRGRTELYLSKACYGLVDGRSSTEGERAYRALSRACYGLVDGFSFIQGKRAYRALSI